MNKKLISTLLLLVACTTFASAQDDLDKYIQRLRQSAKEGGTETAFLSPGAEFIYGQDYFEAKNYFFAASSFKRVVESERDNPYANYQLAISLIKQNDKYKEQEARQYLEAAFRLNSSLKERYYKDVPEALKETNKPSVSQPETLENYIKKLKYSAATGGTETAMNAAGNSALSGIEYFEQGPVDIATMYFKVSLSKEPEDAYINYLLAVSLDVLRNKDCDVYYAKAFELNASLKSRQKNDVAVAEEKYKTYLDAIVYKPSADTVSKQTSGGKLKTGTYACNEVQYTGAKTGPLFRYIPKGYFVLSPDGSYQWLDNGGKGTYKHDEKNGRITWLSGHFKNAAPVKTEYKSNGSITIYFTSDYRWECGCNE